MQEFYRPKQVTELLGISMRTYYTLVEKGKLHPIKIAERVTLISRTEIFNMIENALGETLSQSIFAKGKRFGTFDTKDGKKKEITKVILRYCSNVIMACIQWKGIVITLLLHRPSIVRQSANSCWTIG